MYHCQTVQGVLQHSIGLAVGGGGIYLCPSQQNLAKGSWTQAVLTGVDEAFQGNEIAGVAALHLCQGGVFLGERIVTHLLMSSANRRPRPFTWKVKVVDVQNGISKYDDLYPLHMAQKKSAEENCITEDVVVLVQRDKTYRPFRLKKGRKVFLAVWINVSWIFSNSRKLYFEKVKFYPDGALGRKFGSCFKVEKQQLEWVEDDRQSKEYAPSDGQD